MRNLLLLAAAGLIVGSAGAAFAADDSGKIKSIDRSTMTLTLEDGKSFTLPWKEGDTVKIVSLSEAEGGTVIKSISTASANDQAMPAGQNAQALQETVGKITDIDADQGTIALGGGEAFRIAWEGGDQVKVTFDDGQDGTPMVSAVETVQ